MELMRNFIEKHPALWTRTSESSHGRHLFWTKRRFSTKTN